MAKANDLVALIKERQAQIAKLQAELDEAKALLGAQPKLGPLTRDAGSAPPERPTHRHHRRGRRPRRQRRNSSTTRAEQVLREHGAPLHIDVMLQKIEERFHQRPLKTTLIGNLSRKVKAGDRFYRAAPNTFGLLELRKEK